MSIPSPSVRVPLQHLSQVGWGRSRKGEPVTLGVPLPKGAVAAAHGAWLEAGPDTVFPVQTHVMDVWSDGSVRWVLCDFQVDATDGRVEADAIVFPTAPVEPDSPLRIEPHGDGVVVKTGPTRFHFDVGHAFPFTAAPDLAGVDRAPASPAFRIEVGGTSYDTRVSRVTVNVAGPVRVDLSVEGQLYTRSGASGIVPALAITARVELFARLAVARVAVTVRNPNRATHAGGRWGLGDPGSVLVDAAAFCMVFDEDILDVACAVEFGETLATLTTPFELYQASSGGEAWNAPIHRDQTGRVRLDFRGYRMRSPAGDRDADRATPIAVVGRGARGLAVAVPEFWQHSPRALAISGRTLAVGFFPGQSSVPQELQGGEQKTHVATIAFGHDPVSDPALAWCHDPVRLAPTPAWSCASGAPEYVLTAADDPHSDYQALVASGLSETDGFEAKRERAGEFGWRHFGDFPADHESAFQPPDRPFVSHYNNQYDAIAGCAVQFLRTGDGRWRRLMDELARHVRDIDIYHTTADKAAYNGGLFWHTQHYVDAGISTHRTYPPGGATGGGPSAEHNYTAGLMWHYFLTGDPASRDAAIDLGRWVIAMDDGRRTIFRWLDRGATGLANFTAGYYGPGRGAGHSILALLGAHRLSGDAAFLAKAEELIRRTAHPGDDIAARDLLDAERRWSYTAFLQALGAYLDHKLERGQIDRPFHYARACLLHYARWMASHEGPTLDRADRLEYPTETWAAQDLRKAEVFLWAALFADDDAARSAFLDRARFFFRYAVDTLSAMPSHVFTRPTVLLLSFGARQGWFERHAATLPLYGAVASDFGVPPAPFVPQKRRAVRRAVQLAALIVVSAIMVAMMWWPWR